MGQAKQRKNPDGSYREFKGELFKRDQGSLGKALLRAARRRLYNTPAFQRVLAKRMGAAR
jgi:hypothetical protein